ncbi:MAG: hypothetical protein RI907_4015 [Pseudomonadota bacterium]|jgi:hypothetical protein
MSNEYSTDLEQAQLQAHAENALAVALWHLRQPVANVPGAARKTVQALKALHELRDLPLEPTTSGRA